MSIDLNPTCPTLKRFADDLKLNGKSVRTQQSYCRAARKFAEYLGHSPEQATEDKLRNYLLYLVDCKQWQASTINVAQQALKLYCRITCPREWSTLKLARVQCEQKLPVVISIGEVHTLPKLIGKPSMRCYFTAVYSLGLRLQEGLHLQIASPASRTQSTEKQVEVETERCSKSLCPVRHRQDKGQRTSASRSSVA